MPNLIFIRLYPTKPTTGNGGTASAPSFDMYLTGLSITVMDMSVSDPAGKVKVLGTATYDPTDPNSTIVQHILPPWPTIPPTSKPVMAAVATAVIAATSPSYPEYLTNDLRLQIKRGSQTIVDTSLNYNVDVDTTPPTLVHATPPSPADALAYAALGPTAFYLALPPPTVGLGAGQAYVNLPGDGSPPNYQELYTAVTTVLASDPNPPDMDAYVRSLTPQQCRHIAREITWNRGLSPLPALPNSLENLYTTNSTNYASDQDRQKFEGHQMTYYTTNDTQAEVLAKYVFALSAALACEKKTKDAANAGFELPVLPGIADPSGKTTETDVILSG